MISLAATGTKRPSFSQHFANALPTNRLEQVVMKSGGSGENAAFQASAQRIGRLGVTTNVFGSC